MVLDVVFNVLLDVLFVYYGDNVYVFYGVCDVDDIYNLIIVVLECMWEEGCDLVILVCNIVSVVVLCWMQESFLLIDKWVLGVFVFLIEVLIEW